MSIQDKLSEADLKVIAGINNAVKARGGHWRYPNGMIDGNKIEGLWDTSDGYDTYLLNPDPEWVDSGGSCYNLLTNGEPACVIGFIAVDQGLPTTRESSASVDAEEWSVSHAVAEAMNYAQARQDAGYTWGVTREGFFEVLREFREDLTEEEVEELKGYAG